MNTQHSHTHLLRQTTLYNHTPPPSLSLFVGIASLRTLFLAQSPFYLKKEREKKIKKENQIQNNSAKYSRTYFCRENNKYRIIKLYTRLYLESEGKKINMKRTASRARLVQRIVHALTCLRAAHIYSIIIFYITIYCYILNSICHSSTLLARLFYIFFFNLILYCSSFDIYSCSISYIL